MLLSAMDTELPTEGQHTKLSLIVEFLTV